MDKITDNNLKLMDHIDFGEYLYYDESSITCLRWKKSPSKKIRIGSVAGASRDRGKYWGVRLKGISYRAHRIVLRLHGIAIDGYIVDHINHNGRDNRKTNLRIGDYAQNSRNMSKNTLNTFGCMGVTLSKVQLKDRILYGWVAEWKENGKHCSKYFKFNDYTKEEMFSKAVHYRKQQEVRLGYHENHGEDPNLQEAPPTSLKFRQYDNATNTLICEYGGIREILLKYPDFKPQPIYAVCNGHKKSYRGFRWESFKLIQ